MVQRTAMDIDRKISDVRQYDAGSGDGNHRERKSNLISPKDTRPTKNKPIKVFEGRIHPLEGSAWNCTLTLQPDGWAGR